jgi:hypothetical protein
MPKYIDIEPMRKYINTKMFIFPFMQYNRKIIDNCRDE